MSRNIATDDDLYGDRNMKRPRDVIGTAPSEFAPPAREEPYVPDPLASPSDNRAALRYPYEEVDRRARRVR